MKILSLLFCFTLFAHCVKADMPYMPLKFELTTGKATYMEGEKIDFILTITNTDKVKTYPIITPGGQNSGKKLVYLRVYDPAKNMFVERARESDQMHMMIKYLGIRGLEQLGPGKKLEIKLYWNDFPNYHNDPASHHSFGKALFAGRYMFQAFYDPFGEGTGDSLYHKMSHTEEEQSATKLNFLGPELSTPCEVVIARAKDSVFMVDGYHYICWGGVREGVYQYYLGERHDSNMVHIISGFLANGAPRLEVSMYKYKNLEWLQRFDSGDLVKHSLWNDKRCPAEYRNREYYYDKEKQIATKTDTTADGGTIRIGYNEDGTINFEDVYSVKDRLRTTTLYIYKDGKLRRKKKTEEPYKVPCEMLLEADIKKTVY